MPNTSSLPTRTISAPAGSLSIDQWTLTGLGGATGGVAGCVSGLEALGGGIPGTLRRANHSEPNPSTKSEAMATPPTILKRAGCTGGRCPELPRKVVEYSASLTGVIADGESPRPTAIKAPDEDPGAIGMLGMLDGVGMRGATPDSAGRAPEAEAGGGSAEAGTPAT